MNLATIILFQCCSIPNRNKLLVDHFSVLPFLLSFLFFICCLLLSSFSTVGPLGHLAPATQPRERGGRLFCVERTRFIFWCSPTVESPPFWETVRPSALVLPEEKRTSPERVARNPRKGPAGSSLSGWPQAPSGVPAVLLPFFREDMHRFSFGVQAVSPYRRKPLGLDPWGPSWPRLGPTRGESGPCSEHELRTPGSNWRLLI